MRISSVQIFQQGIEAFGKQQSKLSDLQQQISSGVRLTKPSDDPAASSRVLELEQTVSQLDQYNVNISLAENRLKLEETTLSAVENSFFRIKELIIQANNSSNDETSLQAIGVEIEERYQELLSLANAQDSAGDFLFAGFQNQTQPFTESATGSMRHVVYSGDQGQRSFQVSPTRQITADDSGSKIFLEVPSPLALNETTGITNTGTAVVAPAMVFDALNHVSPANFRIEFTDPTTYNIVDLSGGPGVVGATYTDSGSIEYNGVRTSITGTPVALDSFTISKGQYRDVFTSIDSILDTLNDPSLTSDQRVANLGQSQIDMESFFGNVLDVRTSIGGRLNALESQLDANIAFSVTTKTTISTLRDTDLAEAISMLTLEQTTLDAAQATFAKISSSSLFNFLR
ncbi:MAG: flagellar hook-associated protein FlgL [Gammaproteobacteria bacterium]|jgi:flagellar hook-associated protein 3 FlgL|nr:flagellar hook-associated protein FlgL [Gammaproteobacteria bacterium]MBT4194405.1 flagellar hook-associated protein FlgL [Gammaproteobacteria bacterium]MBT4448451.1 flagellar hook-associated protein FlgL [Gammaproteobacteria bacterium]MBT4862777.1 flagellar hook-associated protein FlgL [Gammaproteobacteria bacterium]MBT6455234.1 flagellar hook-associated protein FlgL [Gammaproteobacteria bacterium]